MDSMAWVARLELGDAHMQTHVARVSPAPVTVQPSKTRTSLMSLRSRESSSTIRTRAPRVVVAKLIRIPDELGLGDIVRLLEHGPLAASVPRVVLLGYLCFLDEPPA